MNDFIDYTGFNGNGFIVLSQTETRITINPNGTKRRTNFWNCLCNCGLLFIKNTNIIKKTACCPKCSLTSKSLKNKIVDAREKRLRTIWAGMKNRCYVKNHTSYKYYGARGISICNEWLTDFNSFFTWAINSGYSDDLSLDRNDTNGIYEPENCSWETRTVQQNNRRDNVKGEYDGEVVTPSQLSEKTGCSYNAAYNKIIKQNKQLRQNG